MMNLVKNKKILMKCKGCPLMTQSMFISILRFYVYSIFENCVLID